MAIKIFDLDVKFEVPIRLAIFFLPLKRASGFLELNAEVKAKHTHFGVTDIWTR